MTEQEFLAVVEVTRLTSNSREAARLHFVEKMSKSEAGAEVGISKQRMSQIVKVVENAQEKLQEAGRDSLAAAVPAGLNHVIALSASYAVAVKQARDAFGDDVDIRRADEQETGVMLGEVVARTDFHLVQSTGRGTVAIHELARLDKVPPIGKTVALEYTRGRASVIDRDKTQERAHTR